MPVSETMTCFDCGQPTLSTSPIHPTGVRNGESFTVEMIGLKCSSCGFETLSNEQSAEFTRLVSDQYRKAHGLLSGEEIRTRRINLEMSQQRFADHLCVGIASVKRWETGQVQEKAMDELIRLKTDPGVARENLRTLEREIPEQCILSVAREVSLVFTAGCQYVHPHAMKVEIFSIVNGEDLSIADNCIAA